MKTIEDFINTSKDKIYYKYTIEKLNSEEKNNLEKRVLTLHNLGAKDPIKWGLTNDISTFMLLKGLTDIVFDIDGNIDLIEDIVEGFQINEEYKNKLKKENFKEFLRNYTKAVMYQVGNLIDEGTYDTKTGIYWSLEEMKDNGNDLKFTEKTIGIHESICDFEEEITGYNNV